MFVARSTMSVPPGSPGAPARVHWAFTDALGSGAPAASKVQPIVDDATWGEAAPAHVQGGFGGFNLGAHVGDDPSSVAANRARLAEAIGVASARVVYLDQVHGRDVAVVDEPWPPGETPPADGVVTSRPGLGLAVLVADCVPVLLADPCAGIIGAAHAGRAGMALGVVTATLERMRELGAHEIHAFVGPSICGRCYEVPAPMRREAAAVRPVSATVTWAGTPGIDVAAGVVDELGEAGARRLTWVPGCTRESAHLYSYRRSSRTGRFAGVVVSEAVS